MPYMIVPDNNKFCVHKESPDGSAGEKVKCHATETEAKEHMRALYANMENDAMKYSSLSLAVKAIGDWELDVLAIPFNSKDSDGQWFDENTDIMHEAFSTPLAVYQHGVKQGAKSLQDKLIVVGKTQAGTLEKKSDGWHIRLILDKAVEVTKGMMEAAKRGMLAVSSGSISHLARLEVGGKRMMYEKNRPGRIAVWPFAEISLWEKGNGNMNPANQFAVALPAMKAIYRDAGLQFPDINVENTDGDLPDADETAVKRARIRQQARAYLTTLDK